MSPRPPSQHDWQEDTRDHRGKAAAVKPLESDPPVSLDRDIQFGQIMASQARIERGQQSILLQLGTLEREQSQLRKDVEKDREELIKGASRKAATHSSNRVAGIMSGLWVLWEIASPYLHELGQLLQRHQ